MKTENPDNELDRQMEDEEYRKEFEEWLDQLDNEYWENYIKKEKENEEMAAKEFSMGEGFG